MISIQPAPSNDNVADPHNSILDLVGKTPTVLAERLSPPGKEIYLKLESFNPMGSVKDRIALGLIEAAERDGSLKPGQTVVEATSGNTGIGLALVCARKGYPLVIVMAESFSVERRKILRFLGAKVVLTPASAKGFGMLAKARELAQEHDWFLVRQFENEHNAAIHEATTGMEIVETFADRRLDYFVSGLGTGGTISGVARALGRHSPVTQIVACEPENSPLLSSDVKQTFNDDGSPAVSHPAFRPHPMQGWSPDFVPAIADRALKGDLIDHIEPVSGADAIAWSQRLACEEGVFCGITAGATFAAAYQVAERAPEGSRILVMIPDTGERYMSTPLFADIGADMNDEEAEISRSTATARFDVSPPPPSASPAAIPEASEKAFTHVDAITQDKDSKVTMFALEWCEFCWSARKLLDRLEIPYHTVNLDGRDYADKEWASDVRRALGIRARAPTIPQIFIDGEHIGGATELFDAHNDGSLEPKLRQCGLSPSDPQIENAYTLLPDWLQQR